jgi:hypothetical protein
MKNVLVVLFMFVSTLVIGQSHLCGAPTKSGHPCKNRVKEVGQNCHLHGGRGAVDAPKVVAVQCTTTAKSTGNRCKNRTTDPSSKCHVHNK